jgi:hypothetical protein
MTYTRYKPRPARPIGRDPIRVRAHATVPTTGVARIQGGDLDPGRMLLMGQALSDNLRAAITNA